MEIIAHRGASAYAVENSLQAVKLALQLKSKAIEIDVHRTMDGRIIVHHDDFGFDINGKKVFFSKTAFNYICSNIILKNGEHPPLLTDVLKLINIKAKLYVEIKAKGIAADVMEVLKQNDYLNSVAITSAHAEDLKYVKSRFPFIPLSLIIDKPNPPVMDTVYALLEQLGINEVSLSWEFLRPVIARQKKRDEFVVRVYTVNDKRILEMLRIWNVDAVFTDRPDIMGKSA